VANGSGGYNIPAPPGLYALAAFATNSVANIASAAFLTLLPGATIGTNLSLQATTETISGKIQVDGNPALGLPGLLVPVQTKNGLLAVGLSDTNGNFTVGVEPNAWKVSVDKAAQAAAGCVGLQNSTVVNTTTNSVSGVPVSLYPATSLFYGTVKDNFGNPLPGVVDVEATDNGLNTYQADGFTDGGGNFVAAALGGLGQDDLWQVQVANSSSFPNYLFSQPAFDQFGGTNLATGQAVPASMIAIIATNQISGHVQTSAGQAIAGVGVSAMATINGYAFNAYMDTNPNGKYSFTVGNAIWNLSVNSQFGEDSLNAILGAGTFQFPPSVNVGITNQNGVANFTVQPCDGIQIVTTNLPAGQAGTYYSFFLDGTTCTGQQNWSVADPLDFPPNLTLSVNGQIQGTPANTGACTFTVQLNDNNGSVTNRSLTLHINAGGATLQITTTTLSNATQNASYSNRLAAAGGTPPYTWSLSPGSASPPSGISLSTNGILSGTPIGSGTATFIPQVADSLGAITFLPLSLTVTPSSLPQVIRLAVAAPSPPGAIQFSFKIASGVTYTIQSSADLKTWTNYQTINYSNGNPTSGETWTITIPSPAGARQTFYRVKVGQ
jgi:hypothetical protein